MALQAYQWIAVFLHRAWKLSAQLGCFLYPQTVPGLWDDACTVLSKMLAVERPTNIYLGLFCTCLVPQSLDSSVDQSRVPNYLEGENPSRHAKGGAFCHFTKSRVETRAWHCIRRIHGSQAVKHKRSQHLTHTSMNVRCCFLTVGS